ncbi:hypothetical protein EVAR_739_1 [Eumeta japonica]|uniref:Zasp-like motif domain-containing protein n=1 Tax=Eumeta variegata TaxID=151549 RepID=A0A4C1SBX7_EUMVA|nr:hypothetical protein EVAR_739_1 [Eumeta japonica]
MAENGYGPMAGHVGRIPNFGKTQVNPMGSVEPPACIQNAMMTKDKKPFTYTPGGLDLSQIKTPSMARRLARQRSQEENDHVYGCQQAANGAHHMQGGGIPPPPPPPQAPAPPPPPPIVIQAPSSKSPKPAAPGERPEIVIPENPIGMLRKTNSPYHWETEKAQLDRMGSVPKYVEKVPSPLTLKMPPSSFSQQPPQSFTPQTQNQSRQNQQYGSYQPESPVHKPSPQYAHQKSSSPNVNSSTPTRELLQRQDSQFNKSPLPFNQSPLINTGTSFSPSPNTSWRQPERKDSPAKNMSPQSPHLNRGPFSPSQQQFSPNVQTNNTPNTSCNYHTLPRSAQRIQDNYVSNLSNQQPNYNNTIYNNTIPLTNQSQNNEYDPSNPAPWRTNTLNRYSKDNDNNKYQQQNQLNQQQNYIPPWRNQEVNNNQPQQNQNPSWKNAQENKTVRPQALNQQQQYTPPWVASQEMDNRVLNNYSPPWRQDANNNRTVPVSSPTKQNQSQESPRYQSHISIPVSPRKPKFENESNQTYAPQKEAVYVSQEPIYFCPDSPKSIPPWVKTQKEKTKTPPPEWCQKPLEGRRSAPRELCTPPRDSTSEPEWVRKSTEMQRNAREVVSPPKYQQTVQPAWSTIPSENRKSLPRDNPSVGSRVIPVQIEDSRRQNQQPQLRIVIDMQNPNAQGQPSNHAYSQPTQRIMRVLSPQLVRLDDGVTQSDLPTLNKNLQNNQQSNQPKTRIIPIQLEGNDGQNRKGSGKQTSAPGFLYDSARSPAGMLRNGGDPMHFCSRYPRRSMTEAGLEYITTTSHKKHRPASPEPSECCRSSPALRTAWIAWKGNTFSPIYSGNIADVFERSFESIFPSHLSVNTHHAVWGGRRPRYFRRQSCGFKWINLDPTRDGRKARGVL